MKIRKITAILCALAIAASLTACGNTDSGNSSPAETPAETAAATTTEKQTEAETTTTAEETTAEETTTTEAETEPEEEEFVKSNNDDNYIYDIYTRHIEIKEYIGDGGDVVIPAEIEGLPVTAILNSAFNGNTVGKETLTSVVIPEGVTSIFEYAFAANEALVSVTLPSTVTGVGYQAFCACPKLENINLQDTKITYLSDKMFSGCESLREIKLPDGLETIG